MLKLILIVALSLLTLISCGRMGDPVPPEVLAPKAVKELKVTAGLHGVSLAWSGEVEDQRGKQLKESSGYVIQRKTITDVADIEDADIEFEDVGTVADTHVTELIRRQEEARTLRKPVHRVKIESDLTKYTFVDGNVQPGTTYFYIVTPVNQGGVEGGVDMAALVEFKGDNSTISMRPYVPPGSVAAAKDSESDTSGLGIK